MRIFRGWLSSTWSLRLAALSLRTTYNSQALFINTQHLHFTRTSFPSTMQSDSKRARLTMNSHISTTDSDILQSKSPYEQRIGKVISVCPKCHGEGKVRGTLSKKAKAKKKQSSLDFNASNDVSKNQPPPTKQCKECSGAGVLTLLPPSLSTNNENKDTSPISNVTIAIIGGGIGGFALAAALQHRNINCIVYERDTSFQERKQGYGLTMQQGARALRSLGFLNDQTANKSTFGIHSTRHAVHTPDGTVIGEWGLRIWGGRYEKEGRSHATRQNAHISRQNLRRVLMDMLKPGSVRWGWKFVGYGTCVEVDGDVGTRPLSLKFSRRVKSCDGEEISAEEEESASVLVGCDGIRSVVRDCKLGEEITPLRYLNCIVILGIGLSPENSPLTDGKTVFQTADGVTRLYAMPFAEPGEEVIGLESNLNERGLSMWQLSFPMDETDAIDLSKRGPSALKAEALRRCGTWHDPIPKLLQSTPVDLVTGYPCYDRALVDKNDLRKGSSDSQLSNAYVTLLGDAAHPMSPFKGQGANQALLDAVLLAQKLYSTIRKNTTIPSDIHDVLPDALATFESEMLKRSAVKVKKSAEAAKFLHSEVAIAEGNVTRGAAADAKCNGSGAKIK